MQKILITIVLTALLLVSMTTIGLADSNAVNVIVEESSDTRTVVRFEINDFNRDAVLINDDTYYSITCGDESNLMEAGAPALPRLCRSIIIPDDARMEINILSAIYEDYANTPVVPSKGNLLRTVNPAKVPHTFGPVYTDSEWYPATTISIREPHIQRDYRGTVIDFNAFQYNPNNQTLRVYTSVTVEVVSAGVGEYNVLSRDRTEHGLMSDFDLLYSRRYINYGMDGSKYAPVGEIGDLLIITYDAFAADMAPLVEWKRQKGIKTTIVNVSSIPNNSTAIASFIQGFYDSTNLAHVLLVGDAAQVATPSASGGSSDPSYAKVAGSDSYPDIFVGRFSAENSAHVQTQVERTVTYETNPPAGDWFHKGTGVASDQGPGHNGEYDNEHMDLIRDKLLAYNYTHVDQIYDPSATSSMVSAALNDGRGVVSYCGHGSTTSWGSSGFSNTNVNALTNNNMLPFIFSVACVNGQFSSYTCFGEAWLRATNGDIPTGAIGAYMSSINQSWDPPMDAEDECIDLLVADEMFTFGGLCFNGSCKMIDINGSGGVDMYNTWHIFGDPSVMVWSNTPAPMTIDHDDVILFGPTEFPVTVVGVEGALCALYKDGVIYGRAYSNGAGIATITFDEMPLPGDELTLTVTSYNGEPYQTNLLVISPEGAYVMFEDAQTNDVTGNNNDILEAGENILLGIELKNVGPDAALDVVATISSTDPKITITDNTEAYGTIEGNDATIYIADGFAFMVAADAPDGYLASFDLSVTGTNRETWTGSF
ncbi:MAG: hypothetical protein KOO62_06930, partial [candidate division Zixibacteria bacterium]|nr:hypothetical protein [candidate division Zixibacteria bacterium]